MQDSSKKTHIPQRSGMVSIEYVAFLPLFLILFGWLLTMTSAGFTKMDTEMAARKSAWENRFAPKVGSQSKKLVTYPGLMKMLAKRSAVNPEKGTRITEKRTGISFFKEVVLENSETNLLVGGTWDHRQIKFQNARSHRPLTPDRMLYQFSFRGLNASEFMRSIFRLPISGGMRIFSSWVRKIEWVIKVFD